MRTLQDSRRSVLRQEADERAPITLCDHALTFVLFVPHPPVW